MEQKILEMLQTLTTTVLEMQKDMGDMQKDMSDMKKELNTRMDKLQENDKSFRAGQQEQTSILTKLEELARFNDAMHDSQTYDDAALRGRVASIEETLTTVGETFLDLAKAQ